MPCLRLEADEGAAAAGVDEIVIVAIQNPTQQADRFTETLLVDQPPRVVEPLH